MKRNQQMIYRLGLYTASNSEIAEDLTQETFLRAYIHLPHFFDGYDL